MFTLNGKEKFTATSPLKKMLRNIINNTYNNSCSHTYVISNLSSRLFAGPFNLYLGFTPFNSNIPHSHSNTKFSPSDINNNDDDKRRREFNLRVGKAIDTLNYELEDYFSHGLQDYDIYHSDIRFSEPYHYKFYLTGKFVYRYFMCSARYVLRWYFSDLSLKIQSINRSTDHELSIRWTMEGTSKPSIIKGYLAHTQYVEKSVYEGIFLYKFDRDGLIIEHQITDLLPVPRRFAPLNAIGWWQKIRTPLPDIADAMKDV